ncbi:MAG: DUF4234 domain-containing protein [Defluviitaleaceae bacterium]|nr:DUF4234 domain-containing protein [Defluviitaleaceae bacterium]MCL2264229.1 DUF4234 domain-containing protein [Defluviitaleaceae bacterium]
MDEMYGVKRSVPLALLFSFITCGIYAWYWLYMMLSAYYRLGNRDNNAGMDIVLSFVTCGLYYYYLSYKMGKLESDVYQLRGLRPKDDSVLYLIMALFGLWFVNYAVMQSNLNSFSDDFPPQDGAPMNRQFQ